MHVAGKGEPMPIFSLGETKNMVTQLILVNLTVFILLFFIQIIYNIEGNSTIRFNLEVLNYVNLPANPGRLLHMPWTLLTSLFVNDSVWMIFSNMVWLWVLGSLLQRKAGNGILLPLYLFGGILGSIFYILSMQLIPAFQFTQFFASYAGSAACIMALAVALLMQLPDFRVFPRLGKGIPMWGVIVAYIVMAVGSSLLTDLTKLPPLIGGALAGFLYMNAFKKGKDWGAGFNKAVYKLTHLFHPK